MAVYKTLLFGDVYKVQGCENFSGKGVFISVNGKFSEK